MKQFLYSSGPTIVASIQNKAYAVISKSLDKVSSSPEKDVFILELRKSINNEHSNNEGEGTTSCEKMQNEEKENDKDKGLSQNQIEQKQMNTIQAVSSYCDAKKGLLYYAVSRYDKSLSIYATPIEIQEENWGDEAKNDGTTLGISPIIVHKTVKRCCSLAFALISPKDKGKESTLVIVAGDLNGDATAYVTESMGENREGNSRVLLGHTASMLTSIEIVEGDHGAKILTSDRDEKVRVSSFPNCFHVEGYLLGHISYVSDVKIVPNAGSSCVSCGGDGTIRLFDYETMQEKCMVQIQGLCENGNNGDGDAGEQNTPIPVRLAVNSSGTVIAVMYDSSTTIQLYSVINDGKILLQLAQTIDCQHTPLGIIFSTDGILNVLVSEPKLIRLKYSDNGFSVVEDQISSSLQAAIEDSQKIVMPKSLLEVDENGKLKLKKLENKANESFVKTEPWLRKERVEVYKQNVKRRKQRKFEKEKVSIVEK